MMRFIICFSFIVAGAVAFEGFWGSQNCLVSEWSNWNALGNGTRIRSRVVLRYPLGGGTPCPHLTETKNDCEVSEWSDWQQVRTGLLSRSRKIISRLSPATPCPHLTETFDTGVLRNETTVKTATRFTQSFFYGGDSYRAKRQTGTAQVRDLLVIMDGSGSIGSNAFATAKLELGNLLALLCPIPNPFDSSMPFYQQVAFLIYSSNVYEIFKFDSYRSTSAIKKAINSAHYPGSSTCTGDAFKYGETMFKTGKGARMGKKGVKQEVLIITDGQSNCGLNAITAAKELKKNTGADVYGIAVGAFGDAGFAEILQYVSDPVNNHLFTLKNYIDFPNFVRMITEALRRNSARCVPFEMK